MKELDRDSGNFVRAEVVEELYLYYHVLNVRLCAKSAMSQTKRK